MSSYGTLAPGHHSNYQRGTHTDRFWNVFHTITISWVERYLALLVFDNKYLPIFISHRQSGWIPGRFTATYAMIWARVPCDIFTDHHVTRTPSPDLFAWANIALLGLTVAHVATFLTRLRRDRPIFEVTATTSPQSLIPCGFWLPAAFLTPLRQAASLDASHSIKPSLLVYYSRYSLFIRQGECSA